ncbi:UNVERIFIED_CONTAM: Anaphase-promoting complex subunit [Sesamum latifolium]|uniref:Anaphase-promoting complex subunit n=1 Tax=Sesamum latifolium TaxID=2727402 RepID=A0AAW2XTA3_9LAMI
MDVPKDQFSTLLDHGLYSSAQILGCFAVSSTSINPETSPHLKAESLQIYKQALQYHKILPKQSAATPPTTRSSLSASNRSSSPNSFNTSAINENEMEGIPSKSRNLEMNLMMAKLYRNSRHTRAAVGCYKECLRLQTEVEDLPLIILIQVAGCSVMLKLNVALLRMITKVKAIIGKNDEAILDFEKVRSLDPYVVTCMDEYAMLLKLKSDHSKLNKLVHDLLNIDPTKPEVFVALSVLWEKKDERGALSYAEKSIRIDERHVAGYIMKAKKFYESALRLEPGFLGAALALAELHVMEGRNGDAVSLLERYLKDWADDSLHVKLAQVFAATNMLQDALSHYQAALRMNPQNEAAKKGLERLEKQMKGVDPDAPEEDEDNEVDDGDGDQEEAELL